MLKLKGFKIEAFLKSKGDRYISLERPITVNNVTFDSIGSQKNKIKVSFIAEAYNEEEARKKTSVFLNNLCTVFLLEKNIPMEVDDIDIVGVQEVSTGKIEMMPEKLRSEVSLTLTVEESDLKDIIVKTKRVEKLDEKLLRFLRWYSKALLEHDPIDKFTHLWIALEIWAEYKGYKKGNEKERTKIKRALMYECGFNEKDANKTYDTRSKLFHSGVDEALEGLPQLEKCLMNIFSKIKQEIFT